MATTQFHAGLGYGGQPYGSFAGKEAASTPAATITQFWAGLGYGGRRYGSFAGKEASTGVTLRLFEGLRRNVGRMMR